MATGDTLLDVQGMIQQKAPDVELRANDALYISEGDGKSLEEQLARLRKPIPEVNVEDLKAVWRLTTSRTQIIPVRIF
jgi:hypothetical protein